MNELEFQAETHALRHELRRLELLNEALIDAGKAIVAERDALRITVAELQLRCQRLERVLYPQTHEQADAFARRGER